MFPRRRGWRWRACEVLLRDPAFVVALSGAQLIIGGIAALAVVTIIGLGYWHYTGLIEAKVALEKEIDDNERLEKQKDQISANVLKLIGVIEYLEQKHGNPKL